MARGLGRGKAPIEKTKKPWQGPIESILKNSAFETRQEKIPESVGKPCDLRFFLFKKPFEGMPCEILILMIL
jgi:hypothetical protein